MEDQIKKGHGLVPLIVDERDFSHHALYGTLGAGQISNADFSIYDALPYSVKGGDTLSALAVLFGVSITELRQINHQIVDPNKIYVGQPLVIPKRGIVILDQTDLDFCTAYCKCEIAYQQFGIQFDPFWLMSKIKQVRGEYKGYGASLRDAALAAVRYGFLPLAQAPFTHNSGNPQTDRPRDFLAYWANYSSNLEVIAARYKLGSFLTVDGPSDAFDNIRSTMILNKSSRRSVDFGLNWRPEWTYAPGGLIQDSGYITSQGEGHDGNFIGQKSFPGEKEPRLIWQQTWGTAVGDSGLFYFPRSVVNKEAKSGYGMFTYTKLKPGLAAWYLQNGIQVGDSWITMGWKVIYTLVSELLISLKIKHG